jgi:hypothetical protein
LKSARETIPQVIKGEGQTRDYTCTFISTIRATYPVDLIYIEAKKSEKRRWRNSSERHYI